ncbi:MAG: methyltransferase domain-containing protein [Acidobacteria bacterium]|nr:methyltransferase domain-containing protein [Acidobacteriota bacterium]
MDHLLRATALAEQRHFWFRGFRAFVTPLLDRAAAGRRNLRLIDCGCGTGNNLGLLGRYGQAFGFDLTASGLAFGREAGRTRLARASIGAIPFRDASFDIVTSFDVLYSLPDVVEHAAARELYRIAKPGASLIVNVAAMEMLRGDHSVLSHELRRYSRQSLAGLLTGAGFEIERITYTNAVLFPPMAAARALQRMRGLSAEQEADQEISVPAAPVNAVLTAALMLESLWLRAGVNNPFGSSLLCLARKPQRV